MWAARAVHPQITKILLSEGAQVNKVDDSNRTALIRSTQKTAHMDNGEFGHIEIVK